MKRLVLVLDEEPVGIGVLKRAIAKFDERRRRRLIDCALGRAEKKEVTAPRIAAD